MSDPEHQKSKEQDEEDQYSRPDCRAGAKTKAKGELGPNATQLLGILQSLHKDKD